MWQNNISLTKGIFQAGFYDEIVNLLIEGMGMRVKLK
jgi:hypothetical protein